MVAPGSSARVATETVAVALIHTERAAVIAGNDAYADLVGRSPDSLAGLPLEAYLDPERAALSRSVLTAMRDGWLDDVKGDIELRRPGGPASAYSWSQVLGARPPHTAVIAGAVATAGGGPRSAQSVIDPGRVLLGTLDDDWRLHDVAVSTASRFGWSVEPPGRLRLHDLVHPADAESLVDDLDPSAVARRPTTLGLRVRVHSDRWVKADLTVSRLHGLDAPPFALVINVPATPALPEADADRANRLEAYLAHIGAQVRAAGVAMPGSAGRFVDLPQLTERQNDIARRLVEGQRVRSIADDLFLSPSTVRNHLSAIFRALGVRSQSELLGRLLTQRPAKDERRH